MSMGRERQKAVGEEKKSNGERKVLLVWLVGQLLGYIADGPQDRASDNFTCCHT